MQFHQVESSNVHAIAHMDNVLHVKFKNGGHYAYTGVSLALFEKMRSADSVGKFLNAHIKPNYPFEKVA